jgi:hypothetical protein
MWRETHLKEKKVYLCLCVCVSVCVREREKDIQAGRYQTRYIERVKDKEVYEEGEGERKR